MHSIRLIRPANGQWGAPTSDGDDGQVTWTGMVGQLSRREADLCGTAMMFTKERSEAIDFGVVLLEDVLTLIEAMYVGGVGGRGDRQYLYSQTRLIGTGLMINSRLIEWDS